MTKALVLGAFVGLALGTFVTVLTVVASSVLAFVQGTRIDIPGIYSVWADDSVGAAGLAFMPNFAGMGLAVVAIMLICMAVAAFTRARTAVR
jgi:hypothetical protein